MRFEERWLAWKYRRDLRRSRRAALRSGVIQRIRECPHDDLRPNPAATAVLPPSRAYVCNGCGAGIVKRVAA